MKSPLLLCAAIAAILAAPSAAAQRAHAIGADIPDANAAANAAASPPLDPAHRAGPVDPKADPSQADHSRMDHSASHPSAREHAGTMASPMAAPPMPAMTVPSTTMPSTLASPMPGMSHAGHAMQGALGDYPLARESSGTAWQPDASTHAGMHAMHGDWMLMAHGVLNAVYDHQDGPRGDDGTFASGMLMGMARRPLGDGTLQLKAMVSPDPLMGARGYPLLLASGETANGVDHLVDRQHPHDFFMELSASVSQHIGARGSVFVYGGLPGEPAFGPPAFMHREAIMDSPEAPITHHWLDSTHISMGVVTAGVVVDRAKLEVSRFNAREPDQHRWNVETGALDSTAIRASWNPTDALALQASWGDFRDPEQLEPGVNQRRSSASVLYAREVAPGWKLAGTLAWGRKSIDHHGERLDDDAFAAEASLRHAAWTWFARAEATENRELFDIDADHGPAYRVGKLSLGTVRDTRLTNHFWLGVGGLVAVNVIPAELQGSYGGRHPLGAMGFVRIKFN